MKQDYSDFCAKECSYKASYSRLDPEVSLLTVEFNPLAGIGEPFIVFVPGLASVIENFKGTLVELTENHKVVYIETREKSTARVSGKQGFSVPEIASDLRKYLENRFTESEKYVLVGYSLGATALAEAFNGLKNKPECIVFVEPNTTFNFPWWSLILARLAKHIFGPVKPFLKWYIKKFRVNATDDLEMYHINCRILDTAEPERLGLTVRALKSYKAGEDLKEISVPALVIGASKDKFHNHDEALDFSSVIPYCRYLDMEDNRRTHSSEAAQRILEFVNDVIKQVRS